VLRSGDPSTWVLYQRIHSDLEWRSYRRRPVRSRRCRRGRTAGEGALGQGYAPRRAVTTSRLTVGVCRTHYLRDPLTQVPKSSQRWVATMVRTIFDQPDAIEVHAPFDRVVAALQAKLPTAALHLAQARDQLLAFTAFPHKVWRQIWSTTRKNDSTEKFVNAPTSSRPLHHHPPGRCRARRTERRMDRSPALHGPRDPRQSRARPTEFWMIHQSILKALRPDQLLESRPNSQTAAVDDTRRPIRPKPSSRLRPSRTRPSRRRRGRQGRSVRSGRCGGSPTRVAFVADAAFGEGSPIQRKRREPLGGTAALPPCLCAAR
jgi:Transposase, Mutator family